MTQFFHYNRFADKDNFFRVQKFGWTILGFWIGCGDEITRFQLLVLTFNCFVVIIYGIFQCCFFYEYRNNLIILFDALTPFLTQIPTVLRVLFLVWHRNELKRVLDYLKQAFENRKIIKIKYNLQFYLFTFL